MRLIDADELIERLEAKRDRWSTNNTIHRAFRGAYVDSILIVRDAPTVEAEPNKDWISVTDRLPPYGERVLVVNEAYEAKRGYTKYNFGVTIRDPHLDFTFWGHKVTYWQPLPEEPKEDTKDDD